MKSKFKYIATVWVPNRTHPGTGKPLPVEFETVVDEGAPAPFYENETGTTITICMEDEIRSYGNIQYRLIVKKVKE